MRSSVLTSVTALFLVTLHAAPVSPKDALQPVLVRMDKAASEFKTMTANVTYVTHTDVINEDRRQTGTAVMQKTHAGDVQSLIEFLTPDKRSVSFADRHLRIYYPNIKTIQEWDLRKHGQQLDQFFLIGFGISGTALAKDYEMSVLPTETLNGPQGIKTIRLRLIPKSGEAHELITQLELWLPETGDPYPLKEKISLPSGDYKLIMYSDLKPNPPLPPDALQLKHPAGVKTEYPGK